MTPDSHHRRNASWMATCKNSQTALADLINSLSPGHCTSCAAQPQPFLVPLPQATLLYLPLILMIASLDKQLGLGYPRLPSLATKATSAGETHRRILSDPISLQKIL